MPVEITFSDSYYKKFNAESYANAIKDTVKGVTEEGMVECQSECPVRTGNLRDSHLTEIDEYSGKILNTAHYCLYVVYGTYKMAANNYPSRAWNNMLSQGSVRTIFNENLSKYGIDVE